MQWRRREARAGGAEVPEGWAEDKFVPLGYEVSGAWGKSSEHFFNQVFEAKEATLCPELVDFNIVNLGSIGGSASQHKGRHCGALLP